ncbi:MAG: hypothetical protein DRO36_06455 [Candidatus Hecatellales archaeon]|nr:MAG: hypothetical protein DRO36_06455 [Candidatus Hecatellales archaeon]
MKDEKSMQVLLDEISKIRQLLEILTRNALKEELEKIATTDERKRIWALCNGLRSTEEIAKKVGVTSRTVQRFVKELRKADLVTIEKRGYPKRRFDYIPSDWGVEME